MKNLQFDVVGTQPVPHLKLGRDRVMRHRFMAWLPDEILALKVEGFVSEFATKVLKVKRDHVKLRVGNPSWLPFARYDHNVPFNVIIKFDRTHDNETAMSHVNVELRPLSRNVARNVLQARSMEVVRAVRGCLMAQGPEQQSTSFSYTNENH